MTLNKWLDISLIHRFRLQETTIQWIKTQQSMSQRLRQHGVLRVELLKNQIQKPHYTESMRLGLGHAEQAHIREVLLWVDDQPWLVGRSVFPQRILRGRCQRLRWLGSQSLGDVIFRDPMLTRSRFEVTRCYDKPFCDRWNTAPIDDHALMARRSVFGIRSGDFLLTEFFLPGTPIYD